MSHRLLVKDSTGERELLLVDRILVGRDPQCEVSVADAQMSRRHAEFVATGTGVVVRDLNSRNGMLVNGRKVLEAVLHPGDVVQVAGLAITFVRAGTWQEAVSMPPAQPGAASRAHPGDDDKTGLMTPEQVAAAAVASMSGRRPAGDSSSRTTVDGRLEPGAVTGGGVNAEPATVGAAPPPDAAAQPPAPAGPASAPVGAPPAVPPAGAEPTALPPPAAVVPPQVLAPLPGAVPALAEEPRVPITEVVDAGWTASLTWQVATLAIVCFLIGALSALPWHVRPAVGPGTTAAIVLLVPLVALLFALALGLGVAARVRRGTLARLSVLAAGVRKTADGRQERVRDPLGTGVSAELAQAINEAIERGRRR